VGAFFRPGYVNNMVQSWLPALDGAVAKLETGTKVAETGLHDMGDPAGCAAHVATLLDPDASWMIVEPIAADQPENNLGPISRLYYDASAMICVPTSLDQEVGLALEAQAGEAPISCSPGLVSAGSDGQRKVRSTWSMKPASDVEGGAADQMRCVPG
jgi:hypothetical protein